LIARGRSPIRFPSARHCSLAAVIHKNKCDTAGKSEKVMQPCSKISKVWLTFRGLEPEHGALHPQCKQGLLVQAQVDRLCPRHLTRNNSITLSTTQGHRSVTKPASLQVPQAWRLLSVAKRCCQRLMCQATAKK